jgi:predicted  nucleic acid-binding Zn-ribbon protein
MMKNSPDDAVMSEKVRQKMTRIEEDLRTENLFLKRKIESYERKFEVLEGGFTNAELVRLNSELGRLNEHIDRIAGQLHALTKDRNEAVTKANYYFDLVKRIRTALGVKDVKEILLALAALKK